MDIQYKPTKTKKEKPAKAPKAEKTAKFHSSVQTVKTSAPRKEKPVRSPIAEKSVSFGKAAKVQTDKPIQVEKAKKPGILSKADPRWILGGALVLIAVAATLLLTVVIPAVEEHGQQINSIMISSTPDKTVYLVGEEANYDGLRVVVTRNNGETFTVRAGKCQISGFDSSKAGYCTVTVNYEGFIASFSVVVEEPPRPTPALLKITLETLPKTEYKVGEWLDTSGGVILCEYVDGSEYRLSLTNSNIFGWENVNGPDEYELTVKYMENGIICETTYTITVTE